MLAHCTEKFQSIHFVSFSSETIAKQQEAMQLDFIDLILSRVHKTSTTFILEFIQHKLNERNKSVSTYSLEVQISTNYQPKPICLKGNYLQLCMTKHGTLA